METKTWKIFGTGIYFYAATILTQYGYCSYFGIPSNFIEPSLRDNVILFFDLLRGILLSIKSMSLIGWIGFIFLLIIIIIAILFIIYSYKWINILFFVIIGISLPLLFFNFGDALAKAKTEFYILPSQCISIENNLIYTIPAFFQTTSIVVPIYADSNKLTGNFLIKEPSQLNCEIQTKPIGKIIK